MRIAFCCKWLHTDQTLKPAELKRIEEPYNSKSIQVTHLSKLDPIAQHAKLDSVVRHNLQALGRFVDYVASLPENQRMVRLGSDILPVYTHPVSKDYYKTNLKWISEEVARVGERVQAADIRLDMHPGPFTVLNSPVPRILDGAIAEIEYHTELLNWMGITEWHQNGAMVNIHLGNTEHGVAGFRSGLKRLSAAARNLLSVENDEFGHGLEDCLELGDEIAVCLDIHHHWVKTGEYIHPSDERVQRVIQSWRGVRPAIHYSQSPEDLGVPVDSMPDMTSLLAQGFHKTKLRGHSDYYVNPYLNQWALGFGKQFDIILESKAKNLASTKLAQEWFDPITKAA